MNFVNKLFNIFGYELHREIPSEFNNEYIDIINFVKPHTLTHPIRVAALINAVKYVIQNDIQGSIVECGVWKGGSMMAVAKTLLNLNNLKKDLYLFDTFEGMTKPTDIDLSDKGVIATEKFNQLKIDDNSSNWVRASLNEVKKVMYKSGYDKDKLHFIKGKVEDTLPEKAPEVISLLRLDTDFYESTRHELVHLFPRLSKGGVIIIDDYGLWRGQRKAVDEYISENKLELLLNRIDSVGRIAVKI